jgi:hypothetical protein
MTSHLLFIFYSPGPSNSFYLITRVIFSEECNLWSFVLRRLTNLLLPGPPQAAISSSTPFLIVKYQVSNLRKTTEKNYSPIYFNLQSYVIQTEI